MKVCPVCKSRCFDDMDVCYGCLHDFKKESQVKHNYTDIQATEVIKPVDISKTRYIPDYFELETSPYIEDKFSYENYISMGKAASTSNMNCFHNNCGSQDFVTLNVKIKRQDLLKCLNKSNIYNK